MSNPFALEEIMTGVWRSRIGKRTKVPSRFINSAVAVVQTSVTACPANDNFVPNKEP
jgi:hypothetical protein